MKPSEILPQILLAEKESIGRLGGDNLELKLSQMTIRFCGDSDVHIITEEADKEESDVEDNEMLNNIFEQLKQLQIEYKVHQGRKS